MPEEFESKIYEKYETEEQLEKYKKEAMGDFIHYAKELEVEKVNRIGSGRTARVFYGKENENICFKIIKDVKGINYLPYNQVDREAEFLDNLQELSRKYDKEVLLPKPYVILKSKESHILAMERMDAVSIEDVLNNKAKLPKKFELEVFFQKLRGFIEEMHKMRIFHRDIHEGNIMIDSKTCRPCLIDFGQSKKTYFSGDDPCKESIIHEGRTKTVIFPNDINALNEVKNRLRERIP